MPECGARTRSGGSCQIEALPDKIRCRLHGSAGGRPEGIPLAPEHTEAMVEGRRRWVERMREAKARGEIARSPGGRRARDLPPLSKDPIIRKAQRIVEKAKAMADQEIATIVELPWEELSHSQKLSKQAGTARDVTAKILNDGAQMLEQSGLAGMDVKLLTLVKDTAMATISTQVRVDTTRLAGIGRGSAELITAPETADTEADAAAEHILAELARRRALRQAGGS